jgi:hypothetical protein
VPEVRYVSRGDDHVMDKRGSRYESVAVRLTVRHMQVSVVIDMTTSSRFRSLWL